MLSPRGAHSPAWRVAATAPGRGVCCSPSVVLTFRRLLVHSCGRVTGLLPGGLSRGRSPRCGGVLSLALPWCVVGAGACIPVLRFSPVHSCGRVQGVTLHPFPVHSPAWCVYPWRSPACVAPGGVALMRGRVARILSRLDVPRFILSPRSRVLARSRRARALPFIPRRGVALPAPRGACGRYSPLWLTSITHGRALPALHPLPVYSPAWRVSPRGSRYAPGFPRSCTGAYFPRSFSPVACSFPRSRRAARLPGVQGAGACSRRGVCPPVACVHGSPPRFLWRSRRVLSPGSPLPRAFPVACSYLPALTAPGVVACTLPACAPALQGSPACKAARYSRCVPVWLPWHSLPALTVPALQGSRRVLPWRGLHGGALIPGAPGVALSRSPWCVLTLPGVDCKVRGVCSPGVWCSRLFPVVVMRGAVLYPGVARSHARALPGCSP